MSSNQFNSINIGSFPNDPNADDIRDAFLAYNQTVSHIMSNLFGFSSAQQTSASIKNFLASSTAAAALVALGAADASGVYSQTQVDAKITALVGTAGTSRDTLGELSNAIDTHTHTTATTSVPGFMSATDKAKLDGVPAGGAASSNVITFTPYSTGTGIALVSTNVGEALREIADSFRTLQTYTVV